MNSLKLVHDSIPAFNLPVEGFILLNYPGYSTYIAISAIDNFGVDHKTGKIRIEKYNQDTYEGFDNSYDNIVDQMNFGGMIDEGFHGCGGNCSCASLEIPSVPVPPRPGRPPMEELPIL